MIDRSRLSWAIGLGALSVWLELLLIHLTALVFGHNNVNEILEHLFSSNIVATTMTLVVVNLLAIGGLGYLVCKR
jgi:hypothetical protein